jgi:hypothetical protein
MGAAVDFDVLMEFARYASEDKRFKISFGLVTSWLEMGLFPVEPSCL